MELILLEYLNCKREAQKMEMEIQNLPIGHITVRNIKGHPYCFLQFRDENHKVCNRAIAEDQIENMQQQIERRKYLKQNIKILKMHITLLEKKYPKFREVEVPMPNTGKGYLTLKGDYVRSKAEVIIANELYHANVFYVYEKPLTFAGCKYTLLPDFTLRTPKTGKTVYWEHCGLMDDDKYRSKWDWKKNLYAQYEISEWNHNLIVTYETKNTPLSVELVREGVSHLLQW